MVVDSLAHADADLAARLLIDARNEAETVVRATEKALRSPELAEIAKTELVQGERERIEAALADAQGGAGLRPTPRRFSARRSCSTTPRITSQKSC